jgi:peptidyl-prolyl cis-trans isomerase SurA
MMKRYLILSCFLIIAAHLPAQDKKAILFTYGGNEVTVEEFEKVYTKNNINNQSNYSEKSIKEYLELFINFKLKTKEAEAKRMDTIASLKNELDGYRKQLAQAYLTDLDAYENMAKEAYERLKTDVKVSHILIKCALDAMPKDTLDAFKKINAVKTALAKKGANFNEIAFNMSEDPSAKTNKGTLGYMTAFMSVYPFENAAFSTPKGKTSSVIRTRYGYHILKVEDIRPAYGKMRAAHILIKCADTADARTKEIAKNTINEIYQDIQTGKSTFEESVSKSEDKFTKENRGELPEFGVSRMVKEFEDAAFALKKDGEISAPVQTKYGWHIIKRLSKQDLKPYESAKKELKPFLEKDSRNEIVKNSFIKKLKAKYSFEENGANKKNLFAAFPDTLFNNMEWDFKEISKTTFPIFQINNISFTNQDFIGHLIKFYKKSFSKPKNEIMEKAFQSLVEEKLVSVEEDNLENYYPKFKELMKEYNDGVFLFELTDREVWSKASKDTAGLKKFYQTIKGKYKWGTRAHVTIYNATSEKIAKDAFKMAGKGASGETIKAKLNKEGASNKITYIDGKFEKGKYAVVDAVEWKKGLSPLKKENDSTFTFIMIHQITEGDPKEIADARGYIVSDYQTYLEQEWIQYLRNKYPVSVRQEVVNSLIKK